MNVSSSVSVSAAFRKGKEQLKTEYMPWTEIMLDVIDMAVEGCHTNK